MVDKIFEILKKRPPDSHKGTFGTLLNVSGSNNYIGAACLSVTAALRSGTGIVCLASVSNVIRAAAAQICECTYLPMIENDSGSISSKNNDAVLQKSKSATACLIGCGMTDCKDTSIITEMLLTYAECQLILDADALNSISDNPIFLRYAKKIPIITPHVGEMSRLIKLPIEHIKSDLKNTAIEFAHKFNCIVVLKDRFTHIASPEGDCYINQTGNAGLAKGGSGDVLAGIISSFAAQGIPPFTAAICGVYLHGAAADRCAERLSQYGMLPSDIIMDLCRIFKENDR